jgi:cytochrome c553
MRFLDPDANGAGEPIGQRIIEVPEDVVRTRARDPASGFIAYAPRGSLARGMALAAGGGGKTVECAICHGPGLKGLGNVPPVAGEHPMQIARALYDIQNGTRNGPDAQLMKRVVAKLDDADIIALSAYVGSLKR